MNHENIGAGIQYVNDLDVLPRPRLATDEVLALTVLLNFRCRDECSSPSTRMNDLT